MSNCVSCGPKKTDTVKTGNDCGIGSSNGDCVLDEQGYPITQPVTNSSGCMVMPDGKTICPNMDPCTYWDMTTTNDTCIVEAYVEEQLNISGAVVNVHKMLGIHEQLSLNDVLTGTAISSGDMPNFPSKQAFVANTTEWRSAVTGQAVIGKSFIGFDFGNIKMADGRVKYGIETAVKHDVATIRIKQGCNSQNRVTKARLERSDDGQVWFGVSMLDIPDCEGLVTLAAKRTVPARYWRLRPVAFNGGANDYWVIIAMQFSEYEKTEISNIQDRILLENRDRDYQVTPIRMKGVYTPMDIQSQAAKFGFYQTDVYSIQVSFNQTISSLGRPFAVGDIIELPSEAMISLYNKPVKKYLMINDVAWATGSYTQSWTPTMLRLLAVPALSSQETQQILGKLTQDVDQSGLSDINDGFAEAYQDISNISKSIRARANDMVPERGEDETGLTKFAPEAYEYADKKNFSLDSIKTRATITGQDGMPPNGAPFTEGDQLPDPTTAVHGAYHRLTYTKFGDDIPPRLYKFSKRIGWRPVDVDRRFESKKTRPLIQEFVTHNTNIDENLN